MTAAEVIDWAQYFQMEQDHVTKWDLYLARISAAVTASLGGKRQSVRDHIIGKASRRIRKVSTEELANMLRASCNG